MFVRSINTNINTRADQRRTRDERFPRIFIGGKKLGRRLITSAHPNVATFAAAELRKLGHTVITTTTFNHNTGILHSIVILNFEHKLSDLEAAKNTAKSIMCFYDRNVA